MDDVVARIERTGRSAAILLASCFLMAGAALAHASTSSTADIDAVQIVRKVMETPDDRIDFARAKFIFDELYDPATNIDARMRDIDGMVRTIRTMAGPSAPTRLRLILLRKYIYEAGAWNNNKPFQYDLSDPFGRTPANRLLSTYLLTHRGNCVSMPILFVALAQRLGLDATLSTAPNHMFVKYTDDVTGKTFNLETTSGAYPARDAYIRQNMPMTDQAIANGIYMKKLSKKEALAVMADIVLEREFSDRQYQKAWNMAEVLRPYYPNNLAVLLAPSNAALGLIQEEFVSKYPTKADIPPELMDRFNFLEKTVPGALNKAYALGWRETAH